MSPTHGDGPPACWEGWQFPAPWACSAEQEGDDMATEGKNSLRQDGIEKISCWWAFEATVGVHISSGGRRTELG